MKTSLDTQTQEQINQCISLLQDIMSEDLLGIYLYGSAIIGGLQKYSDLDLLVITNRNTTSVEKTKLISHLLAISGVYKLESKRPLEMTIVVKSEVNPWQFPPKFDFQYGEWLRDDFEKGKIEYEPNMEMPDLALLITQVLLANETLWGEKPQYLLSNVPYRDFMLATISAVDGLMADINSDTRNVLLTLARIWCTLSTDKIRSKPAAADWASNQLPDAYQSVMQHAKAICIGEKPELWAEVSEFIKPCAQFIIEKITQQISLLDLSDDSKKSITYFIE